MLARHKNEQQERERLEKQVVDSFYQVGVALRELRDPTTESQCRPLVKLTQEEQVEARLNHG